MKPPGKKDKKPGRAKQPTPAGPTPTLAPTPARPVMDGLRRDAPARAIDLSSGAFRDTFPGIAERLAEQRRQHRRRREQEKPAAGARPASQTASQAASQAADPAPPAMDKDEDT